MFSEDFSRLLDEYAVQGWRDKGCIRLVEIPNHLFKHVDNIVRELQSAVSSQVVAPPNVFIHGVPKDKAAALEDPDPGSDRWEVRLCSEDLNLMKKRIRKVLAEQRLDWIGDVDLALRNFWSKGRVDRQQIDKWLLQFDEFGKNHQWIGEKLLRLLDLWPDSRLLDALDITKEGLDGFNRVCCNTARSGESGGLLRSLVKRPLRALGLQAPNGETLEVQGLHDVLSQDAPETVLFLEDCLTTGTQMLELLQELTSCCSSNGQARGGTSRGPRFYMNRMIQFRFGTATDLGRSVLEGTFAQLQLSSCEVSVKNDCLLRVLTDDGRIALEEGTLWAGKQDGSIGAVLENALKDPRRHVSPYVFQNPSVWGGPMKHVEAMNFCKRVGRQLFKSYIDKKATDPKEPRWSAEKIDESSLGVRNLGLALAFQYCVPPASLPLFWAEGEVHHPKRTKPVHWKPLFPHAR
jgi:hypothetical protein